MIPNSHPKLRWLLPVLAALLVAGCGDARSEAAEELVRLNDAMQRHSSRYGRFPDTLDAGRPLSAANLPYRPERDVTLSLQSTGTGYRAAARRKSWYCWTSVGPDQQSPPDCYPMSAGSSGDPRKPAEAPKTLEPVLRPPGAATHSSSAPDRP
ncbi:MAG TPA: hypothetical protein VF584_14730 [Longimicrobium sp.]|jgi:hypothetical protein